MEEAKQVYEGAGKLPQVWQSYFRLLHLSGLRRTECSCLWWEHIQGDQIVLPAKITKSSRSFIVPLAPQAMGVLEAVKPLTIDTGWIFTSTGTSPIKQFTKFKTRLDEACGVTDWQLHDLRRTLMSWLAAEGCPLEVADRMLNHSASASVSGVMRHYLKYDFLAERREWLTKWSDALTEQ
nr:site-specific integrase [Pseudoruegeria sp. HB172150]